MSKEIKQEIKETVTKLANANLNFTIEDELEFAKVAVKSAEQKLEQVKLENKRLLEIINTKPFETVDIDSAFEIEKLKEQLQTKEQKIKSLKANIDEIVICDKKLKKMLDKKEQEIEQVKKFVAGLMFDVDCTNWFERFVVAFEDWKTQIGNDKDKYKQALDEISKILDSGTADTQTNNAKWLQQHYLARFCEIRNIINKANTAPATIFDRIRSFDSGTLARFIHALISCHEKYTCDDCYIAALPFQRRICDTKETLEDIKDWLREEFKE